MSILFVRLSKCWVQCHSARLGIGKGRDDDYVALKEEEEKTRTSVNEGKDGRCS